MRVLSISTLFPSPARPAFGKFVAYQMEAIAARDDVDLAMLNPIGVPPWPLRLFEPYRRLNRTPRESSIAGVSARHPRFALIPRFGGPGNARRLAKALLPVARKLHAESPFDLVDAQFFYPDGPAAASVAQDLHLPLTIAARGSDIHYWGTNPAVLRQILTAADQTCAIQAVSNALRLDMIALGMPEDRINVHYTGLDRKRFHPTERQTARKLIAELPETGIPEDGPLIVTPGALIPLKGQRFAIEALALLPGTQLAIAGTGPEEKALRALAARLGLSCRVHFLGQVAHEIMPKLLSAGDVMILPSEREGLANVWIEALACGTPLVIPDIGGAREVLRNPSAGRIAAREAGAIAEAVREILADPPNQEQTGATVAHFDWQTSAANLAAIWRKAAAG